jgi:hypothetical protein
VQSRGGKAHPRPNGGGGVCGAGTGGVACTHGPRTRLQPPQSQLRSGAQIDPRLQCAAAVCAQAAVPWALAGKLARRPRGEVTCISNPHPQTLINVPLRSACRSGFGGSGRPRVHGTLLATLRLHMCGTVHEQTTSLPPRRPPPPLPGATCSRGWAVVSHHHSYPPRPTPVPATLRGSASRTRTRSPILCGVVLLFCGAHGCADGWAERGGQGGVKM